MLTGYSFIANLYSLDHIQSFLFLSNIVKKKENFSEKRKSHYPVSITILNEINTVYFTIISHRNAYLSSMSEGSSITGLSVLLLKFKVFH